MLLQPRTINLTRDRLCLNVKYCLTLWLAISSFAASQTIEGRVTGAGAPIARSAVTLWSASPSAPKQLAQTQSGDDGRFTLSAAVAGPEDILYIVAKGGRPTAHKGSGDNPAIALISVLGNKPPAHVTVNEFTTIASVWTTNQSINGTVIQGYPLGLKIAAGNVPNFVDLQAGGWGETIQDPLNSGQTQPWRTSQRSPTFCPVASHR